MRSSNNLFSSGKVVLTDERVCCDESIAFPDANRQNEATCVYAIKVIGVGENSINVFKLPRSGQGQDWAPVHPCVFSFLDCCVCLLELAIRKSCRILFKRSGRLVQMPAH